jgi:hypothetical protein
MMSGRKVSRPSLCREKPTVQRKTIDTLTQGNERLRAHMLIFIVLNKV